MTDSELPPIDPTGYSARELLVILEYRKAFGNRSLRDIRGPQFRKQRKAFLTAVNGSNVRSRDAGICAVETVLYFNVPCGFCLLYTSPSPRD